VYHLPPWIGFVTFIGIKKKYLQIEVYWR